MQLRVLNDALQHRRQHRLHIRIVRKLLQRAVHEIVELLLELVDVAAAFADGFRRLAIVQERVEHVLERHVLVAAGDRVVQRELESLL